MTDLKPCPFCGSDAELDYEMPWPPIQRDYYVRCSNSDCGIFYPMYRTRHGEVETKDGAIEKWNTRAEAKL